jgi:hypothetical protein
MIFPTVHLNGTSKQSLLDGYIHALEALRAAQDALAACGPNPRDYYLQGAMAGVQAAKEHAARYVTLTALIREIEAIAEKVSDQ